MRVARIADISEFVLDGTHGSPVRTATGVPVLSAQNVKGGSLTYETARYTSHQEHREFERRLSPKPGDLLLTIVGTIGRAAVVQESRPVVFQRSVAVIRPRSDIAEPRYLYHATQTPAFQRQLTVSSNQSSQAGVYLGRLRDLSVPIPPLVDQRWIAGTLDRVDALRTKRRAALAQARVLARSMFHELFEKSIGNDWRTATLDSVADILTGYPFQSRSFVRTRDRGIALCRGANVLPGRIDWDDLACYPLAQTLVLARFSLTPGDVVLAMDRPWITDGFKIAQVTEADCPALLVQRVARIRGTDEADSTFLFHLLTTPAFTRHCRPTETTVPHISPREIRDFTFRLPPRALQHAFRDRVTAAGKLARNQYASFARMDELFDSLQHRAFSEKL